MIPPFYSNIGDMADSILDNMYNKTGKIQNNKGDNTIVESRVDT